MTVKISNLPAATSVGSGDVLPVVQSGTTKKIDLNSPWSINIDGGNIDGTPIGVSSASSGAFTTLTASDDVNFDSGTLFVDASTNNVGIGTTSPNAYANYSTLTLNNSTGSEIDFESNGTLVGNIFGVSSSFVIGSRNSLPFRFLIDNSEAMRIDSSGNVLIGTTVSGVGAGNTNVGINARGVDGLFVSRDSGFAAVNINQNRNGTNTSFFRSGVEVGSVSVTTTTTTYNTSSDYRLKENAQPITGALDKVQALNPVRYNWRADGSEGEGFIAHELQEVVPYAVSGEKDGEKMQGVDYGKLTTLLTAAIKELKAELDELKGSQ